MTNQEVTEVIAEFMGQRCKHSWTRITDDSGFVCRDCLKTMESVQYEVIPDYPNDMNALLGVMDKLEELGCKFLITSGEIAGEVSAEYQLPNQDEYGSVCGDWVNLPSVLAPLLAEAIRGIKT